MGSNEQTSKNEAVPSDPDEALAQEPRASIGVYLSRQRELRGITLEELAELTRIPLRSLQRLESGQFDADIDGFVRGFVRTVAQALGLDPDDTVARMLEEPSESGDEVAARLSLGRVVALAAAALVVAGGLVLGRLLLGGGASPTSGSGEVAVVYRVDPVRALAEAAAESGEEAIGSVPLRRAPESGETKASGATLPTVSSPPPEPSDAADLR